MSPAATEPRSTGRRLRAALLDPRLIVGAFLVTASVIGTVALVTAADRTVDVYVARHALAPGDVVRADDLLVHAVAFTGSGATYLVPGDIPESGAVVGRFVGAGELVPRSAIGSERSREQTAVVVTSGGVLPSSVTAGATVDVWATVDEDEEPVVVVEGASVVRLIRSDGIVSSDEAASVELLVPRERVARLLESIAVGGLLSVVPATLPLEE